MKIEKGAKESYAPRVTPGPAMLVEAVMSEIEGRLAGSAPPAEVAERLGVKLNTEGDAQGKDPNRLKKTWR